MNHKAKAKELLRYYIELAIEQRADYMSGDMRVEVNEIVDHIIAAAVAEVLERLQDAAA